MSPYRVYAPTRLEEAIAHLSECTELVPVAGGTDLLVVEPDRRAAMTRVLSLLEIEEIRDIETTANAMTIGAAVTFTRLRRSPDVATHFPMLAAAAATIGGWQIQNRATLGGNAANASPAGDSLPVLLALDATAVIAGPEGTRELPYAKFHVGYRRTALRPGEILAWIRLPLEPAREVQRFRKVGTRKAHSISKVVAALSARRNGGALADVRVAAGSVADRPVRLVAAEAVLEGKAPSEPLATAAGEAAAGEVVPIDDVRSTAAYRTHVLSRIVRRLVLQAGDPAGDPDG